LPLVLSGEAFIDAIIKFEQLPWLPAAPTIVNTRSRRFIGQAQILEAAQ